MKRELLDQLISAIGEKIEIIGKDIRTYKFVGLAKKLEELYMLIESARAAEGMRGL